MAALTALFLVSGAAYAQTTERPSIPTARRDSLLRVFHAAKAQLRQVRQAMRGQPRFDEYTDNKGRPIRYHIVKADLPNWLFGEPNLGYERKISHHATLLVHAAYSHHRYQREGDSVGPKDIYKELLRRAFYPAQFGFNRLDTRSRSFKLVPEVRVYLGRNAPRGFYLGAYYLLNGVTWDLQVHTQDSIGTPILSKGRLSLLMHGPGMVWGAQWLIRSRVSLGFEMGASWMLGEGVATETPLTPTPGKQTGIGRPFAIGPQIRPRLNCQIGYCFGR